MSWCERGVNTHVVTSRTNDDKNDDENRGMAWSCKKNRYNKVFKMQVISIDDFVEFKRKACIEWEKWMFRKLPTLWSSGQISPLYMFLSCSHDFLALNNENFEWRLASQKTRNEKPRKKQMIFRSYLVSSNYPRTLCGYENKQRDFKLLSSESRLEWRQQQHDQCRRLSGQRKSARECERLPWQQQENWIQQQRCLAQAWG